MTRYVSFGLDIFASLGLAIMILCLMAKKKKSKSQKLPIWLLFEAFCFVLADALYNVLYANSDAVVPLFIFKTIYFVFNAFITLRWSMIISDFNEEKNTKANVLKVIHITVFSVNCILLLINLFYNIVFSISDSGTFDVSIPGMLSFTILNFASFIIASISLFLERKSINKATFKYIASFPIPALVGEIATLIYKNQSFISLYALSGLLILIFVQLSFVFIDPMTKLSTKAYFSERLDRWFYSKKPLAVNGIIISINNIHEINKKFGYSFGDFLIIETTKILTKACKGFAIPFRTDGNEFVIGFSENINESTKTESIIKYIENEKNSFNKTMAPDKQLELSIGTYSINNTNGCPEDIMRIIELKSYKTANELDRLIDDALKNHKFMVYYQPIFDAASKKFINAEALLRYKGEDGKFVSPQLIIEQAEKSDRIFKITKYVLNEVCEFIKSNDLTSLGVKTIEVNLSTKDISKEDIDRELFEIIDRHNVPHNLINFEMTETFYSLLDTSILNKLELITSNGCGISLDDYGSGYSNLTRLAQLPLKYVKIDKELTNNLENPKIFSIMKNIIPMLNELNIDIIIEGIEYEKTRDQVVDLGISLLQGYLYSKPLEQNSFLEFIKSNK